MSELATREVDALGKHNPRPGAIPNEVLRLDSITLGLAIDSKGERFILQIDESDYPSISGFRWYVQRNGYTEYAKADCGCAKNCRVYAHRVLTGYTEVDHADHNGLNNKRTNLRSVSRVENCRNRRRPSNNKSGFLGVSWNSQKYRWEASASVSGKKIHLGFFHDVTEAAEARDRFVSERYEGFGVLNG